MTMKAEIGVFWPEIRECRVFLEVGKEKKFFLRPSKARPPHLFTS